MKRWIVVAVFSLTLLIAPSAMAEWVFETVASTGDQGQFGSVALDSEGIVHLAWYDASNARLAYGVREFTGWTTEVIDTGNVGKYAHIDMNPITDQPAIAYHDDNAGEAMYAYYDGSWHTEQIVYEDDDDEGKWIDLTFKSDGTPYISYHYNNGAFHTIGVNVVWKTVTGWDGHRLDSYVWPSEMGNHTSIVMSSADFPQIAYQDSLLSNQKFGWRDGTGWHTENATDPVLDFCGEYVDIARDEGDNIFISSFDVTTLGDNCVAVITKVAGDWDKEEIECGGGDDFGKYTSIEIDSGGNMHVTYCANDELRYAVETTDGWDIQTVDDDGVTGKWTGLVLDGDDNPYIVYYNETAKDVIFAWDMPIPAILDVNPDNGLNTGTVTDVVVTGTGFTIDSTVRLFHPDTESQIPGTNVIVASANQIVCDFDLTGAIADNWNVHVTNPAGTGILEDGFRIDTLPPELASITPASGVNDDEAFDMTLTGSYFTYSLTAWLQKSGESDVEADAVAVNAATEAVATFNLLDLATGDWDVAITTGYGTDTLDEAFEITCGPPTSAFDASPLSGPAPLTVSFYDESTDFNTCEITSWDWDFGDEGESDEQNPQHVYTESGTYTVSLTVTSAGGTDMHTETSFVTVTEGDDDDDTGDDDDDDDLIDDDDDRGDDDDDSGGCGC